MSGGNVPSGYQPKYQGAADSQLWGQLGQTGQAASNLLSWMQPQAYGLTQQFLNNPYATGAQNWANEAGGYMTGTLAPEMMQASQGMFGAGNAAMPYGQQMLQQGFDPQNALYNRTAQQVMDQSGAINAASGLSGSPYGAGVTGQNMSNFNLDWQNNQLARQSQAAQGAGGLYSGIGQMFGMGSELGGIGAQTMAAGGQLPSSTYTGNLRGEMGALGGLDQLMSGAMAPGFQQEQGLEEYMRTGQSATSLAQNAAYQNAMMQMQQMQGFGQLGGMGLEFLMMGG